MGVIFLRLRFNFTHLHASPFLLWGVIRASRSRFVFIVSLHTQRHNTCKTKVRSRDDRNGCESLSRLCKQLAPLHLFKRVTFASWSLGVCMYSEGCDATATIRSFELWRTSHERSERDLRLLSDAFNSRHWRVVFHPP